MVERRNINSLGERRNINSNAEKGTNVPGNEGDINSSNSEYPSEYPDGRQMGFFGWGIVLACVYIAAPFIWVWDFIKGEGR